VTTATLHATWLLASARAGTVDGGVAVRYDASGIAHIERNPGDASATLLMPPLANAHDHGRGVKTLAYGASTGASMAP
jgi:hypothetical protein